MPPYEDEDLENQEELANKEESGPPIPMPSRASFGAPQAQPPPQSNDINLQDYLMSKHGDLGPALAAQQSATYQNNLGKAFNQIGSSLGQPGKPVDQSFYDEQNKQAQLPVQMAESDQKTKQQLMNYLRQKQGLDIRQKSAGIRDQLNQAKLDEMKAPQSGINTEPPTPEEKAEGAAFGKDVAEYRDAGGYASILGGIKQMRDYAKQLRENPDITGTFASAAPDVVRAHLPGTVRQGLDMQQGMQKIILGDIRHVFPGRVAQDMAKMYLIKSFDPNLPGDINAGKLEKAADELEQKANAKQEAVNYYQKNHSLRGFKSGSYSGASQQASNPNQGKIQVRNKKTGETKWINPGEAP